MYFVQGFAEPCEGLITQPTRKILDDWGYTVDQITMFTFLLGLPWWLKPIFGMLSDFFPLNGTHRRSYLLGSTLVTALGLLVAAFLPLGTPIITALFLLLILPTFGVAFTDVVTDAHMVERAKPLGITGQIQSVQWASIYGAGLITGTLGGWLTEHKLFGVGFGICAGLAMLSFFTCYRSVREAPRQRPQGSMGDALQALWTAAKSPVVLGVGGYLFLLNFNPFSSTILNEHVTGVMGLKETDYGDSLTIYSAGCIAASLTYGAICRRLRTRMLVRLSIIATIVSTLLYLALDDALTYRLISFHSGYFLMMGGLVSLDMAARSCDPESAGTVFALLMALCNFSMSISGLVGGQLYVWFLPSWGAQNAFDFLVIIGALSTAAIWVLAYLVPILGQDPPPPLVPPGLESPG